MSAAGHEHTIHIRDAASLERHAGDDNACLK